MGVLNIMMGAPGSGKSTFVKNHYSTNTVAVSRDAVRFSMVAEKEEYFSKEKDVFREFIRQIDDALEKDLEVFADATHLNRASRLKLMNAVNFSNVTQVNVVYIKTSLEDCLRQNENRIGTRSYVPDSAIRRMYYSIEKPELEEGFDNIYIVEKDKPISIITKWEDKANEMVCIN